MLARSPTSRALQVDGPDVTLDASGRLALGRAVDLESQVPHRRQRHHRARHASPARPDSTARSSSTAPSPATPRRSRRPARSNGNGLAYGENKALDLDSTYAVTVPDLDFVNARVQATSEATFVEIAGVADQSDDGDDDVRGEAARVRRRRCRSAAGDLAATGSVVFHPDHQEIHLPQLALRREGIEWRNVPGSEAADPVSAGRGDDQGSPARERRSDAATCPARWRRRARRRRARSKCTRATSIWRRSRRLLLQNRGLSGRLTADATITGSLERADRRRQDRRSPTADSRPTSMSRSSPTSTTRTIASRSTRRCSSRPACRSPRAARCR